MPRVTRLGLIWSLGVSLALVGGAAHADPAAVAGRAVRAHPKLSGRLPLFFLARPSVLGGTLSPASHAPVVVELDRTATAADVVRLSAAGLERAASRDVFVWGQVSADALERVAETPHVQRVVADGSPFGILPPLDNTAAELEAPDVWRSLDDSGLPVTGLGQSVCVVDVGIDVYHPVFFRADGGYWAWRDVDGNGAFTDGVDTLNDGTVLRSYNSIVFSFQSSVLFDSNDGSHIAGIDWIYADENGNGKRDMGPEAGYGDATPTFGEPLFTSDDVNANARLDFGERLVALGSSKVQLYQSGLRTFSRGFDMTESPRIGTFHGTASSSIVAGGQRGFGRFVGLAPDADIIMAQTSTISELFARTDFCLRSGARVVLHEYAEWQSFFLDGSSPLERLVSDSMRAGVAHVTPVGNLAGAMKAYKRVLPSGGSLDIAVDVPTDYDGDAFALFGISILWKGDPDDLEIVLTDGSGQSMTQPAGSDQQPFHSGLLFISDREVSPRGTARADIFVFSDAEGSVKLTPGRWNVAVRDRSNAGATELFAFLRDDLSRWDVGIHFPEFASEDHLVGYPSTADAAIGVAAYTGTGYSGTTPGERAVKSGRGTRIDGANVLSVSAPEDPVAAVFFEKHLAPMGPFSGTSGASPHVAAAAALMLQADPGLTGIAIRDALRAGAAEDANTGPVPNDDWGYGKLRIFNSLYGVDPPTSDPPSVSVPVTHVDVGDRVTVSVSVSDPDDPRGALVVELDRQYDGVYDEVLDDRDVFTVAYDSVGVRFLKVRATDPSGRSGAAVVRVEVHSTFVPSGGLACIVSGSRQFGTRPSWPWGLLWLSVGCVAHVRRRTNAIPSRSAS